MYSELYEKSGSQIIREIGQKFKNYRKTMGLTQKEVSKQSGLSVLTISTFENGSSTGITLASFIRLLRAIEFLEEIEKLLPELPPSPRQMYYKQKRK